MLEKINVGTSPEDLGDSGLVAAEKIYNNDEYLLEQINRLEFGPISRNIFNKALPLIDGKYVDTSNGSLVSSSGFKVIQPIKTLKSKIYVSGLGSVHHGLGWRIIDEEGNILKRGTSSIDVTSFSANASDISHDGDIFFQCTVKTGKSGDNTNVESIQIEYNEQTEYTSYKEGLAKVHPVEANSNSPASIGYVQDFVFANSLTENDFGLVPISRNIFNKALPLIDGKYVDATNGSLQNSSSYKSITPVNVPKKLITISGVGTVHHGLGWRFIDDEGNVLKYGVSSIDVTSFSANASDISHDGDIFFQCTVKTGKSGDNTNVESIQIEVGGKTEFSEYEEGLATLKGRKLVVGNNSGKDQSYKVLFLGDSITTEDNGANNWPAYFRSLVNVGEYWNYARSGASFTNWSYDSHERQQLSVQIQTAIEEEITPDVIIIAIGTNDYARYSSFGDYDTAIGKDIEDLDLSKVIEAARWAFYTCKEQWGSAICFYANPLQRVSTANSTEVNDNGNWLREPIERMARRYGFIILDQYGECGIVKDFENASAPGRYLSDGLHTNSDGKAKQGQYIAAKVKQLL